MITFPSILRLFSHRRWNFKAINLDGFGLILSVNYNINKFDITYQRSDLTTAVYSMPEVICNRIGFDNSYTGITPTESQELGWMVALVLFAAWGIKAMRKGL